MKKIINTMIISCLAFLMVLTFEACKGEEKSIVPVYQGMTINRITNLPGNVNDLRAQNAPENSGNVNGNGNPHVEKNGDPHQGNKGDPHKPRIEFENDIEDIVKIDVFVDNEVKYYVQPNEVFIIEIHIDNPNDYEIQSFTLNGKKYANYMFKDGSTMELLLLEVTAPDMSGYSDYSIDAIKYIDGTEIKDVDMSSGNKTIRTGVTYTSSPTAIIGKENITTTSIDLDITINDDSNLIGNNELSVYLFDGEIVTKKGLKVGQNKVLFDNLTMSTLYEYGVITVFDMLDGEMAHPEWLLRKTFSTMGAFQIENIKTTVNSISFELENNGDIGTIDAISLYNAMTNELVEEKVGIEEKTIFFNELFSNHLYNLYVDYSYESNSGETISDWIGEIGVRTQARTMPTVVIENIIPTQTSFTYEVTINDAEGVGSITKIELLYGDGQKIEVEDLMSREFSGLLSDSNYSVSVTYTYDLNDGNGIQTIIKTESVKTKTKRVPMVNLSDFFATKNKIECKLDFIDFDDIGSIIEIGIKDGEDLIQTTEESTSLSFDDLQSGIVYTIYIQYDYDLNDGKGINSDIYSVDYPTLVDSISVEEIILLNNSVVKSGEELNMRIYFNNPSEIEMTAIYVNGQKVTVVGGDRIESAIIKFIPNDVGLIDFYVDKVDYLIGNINISQRIDRDVMIQYPVYGDLNVKITPITSLYYGISGDGTYLEFDNPYQYEIYKINNSTNFKKLGENTYCVYDILPDYDYFTEMDWLYGISSVEYGYDGYGSSIQKYDNYQYQRTDYGWEKGIFIPITTPEEFLNMSNGCYFLMNDLDMRKVVQNDGIRLTGILYGNGHTVRGLTNVNSEIFVGGEDYLNGTIYGSAYDVNFTEVYIQKWCDGTILQIGLGNVYLGNCSIKGDIEITEGVKEIPSKIDWIGGYTQSISYQFNISSDSKTERVTKPAEVQLEKNKNVEIMNDRAICFNLPNGEQVLLGIIGKELLSNFSIPNGVTSIIDSCFYNCNNLKSITIPDSVTKIEGRAFYECSNLTSITLPDSITSIGEGAFYNCSRLTSITLGNSVTSIGEGAFYGCNSLTSVYYTGDIASWCGIKFGNEYSNPLRYAHNLYINNELIKDIVIPDTVTEIKARAFYNWNGTSITIPASVTSIGEYAFYDCSNLTSVYYTGDIASWCGITFGTYISCNPLIYAHNLYINNKLIKDIVIPDTVTEIKDYAFSGWDGTSITIPDSVTSIGEGAFYWCSSLTSVYYTGDIASWCGITFGDSLSNPLRDAHNLYIDNELIKEIVIPDTVTEIGYQFTGWNGTSITIPDSVTNIGNDAFFNCSSLTSITIPGSVTSIGDGAFYECRNLTSIAFQGTKAQWNAISKGSEWNYETGDYMVHCSDGDIPKN